MEYCIFHRRILCEWLANPILLASNDKGVFFLSFESDSVKRLKSFAKVSVVKVEQSDLPEKHYLLQAIDQLEEYFSGKRKLFTVPLDLTSSKFYTKVFEKMILDVKYGDTISYSDLAELCGNPRAFRAVASANKRNPIPILVPCHRVLGKSGGLTGYSACGGLALKRKLLSFEKRNNSKILGLSYRDQE